MLELAPDFTPTLRIPQWTAFLTTASGILGLTNLSAIQAPPGWSVATTNGQNDLGLVYLGQPSPPIITAFKFITNGGFQLSFTGLEGSSYHVWAASNLALPFQTGNWTALVGGVFGSAAATYTDTQVTSFSQRFYLITIP